MRTRTTATALLLIAALAGCSSSSGGDEGKPAAAETPTASPEEQFLTVVHDAQFASWADSGPTDAELAAYPPKWCAEFEKGHSVDHVLNADAGALYPIGAEWGTKKEDAQELLVLGVKFFCPELRQQVTEDLRDSGAY